MRRPQHIAPGLLRSVCLGVLASGFLIVALTGCEEDVTAVLGTEMPFTLYGVITPQSGTQEVIVFPIEGRLAPRTPEPLDARFTTTDLTTGDVHVWQDSVVQEPSGLYEHVFWSTAPVEYGRTYRIEVKRSDGAVSTALAKVPVRAELVLQDPVQTPFVVIPVLVNADVPRLMKIELAYYIKFAEGDLNITTTRVVIPYDGKQRQVEGGWLISLNLTSDYRTLRDVAERQPRWDPAYGVAVIDMTLRLLVAAEDWDPPGGVFDPEVLVQPGIMSNVENGYGFIGAGYRLSKTWRPDEHILTNAGFRPFAPEP